MGSVHLIDEHGLSNCFIDGFRIRFYNFHLFFLLGCRRSNLDFSVLSSMDVRRAMMTICSVHLLLDCFPSHFCLDTRFSVDSAHHKSLFDEFTCIFMQSWSFYFILYELFQLGFLFLKLLQTGFFVTIGSVQFFNKAPCGSSFRTRLAIRFGSLHRLLDGSRRVLHKHYGRRRKRQGSFLHRDGCESTTGSEEREGESNGELHGCLVTVRLESILKVVF
mmetsp:Transcript_2599/g.5625  ORF Transcript_2599/g.5625 Transcript_2599/m.5625 type:complete len:219 (-) Transcript_2599:74-730(-)